MAVGGKGSILVVDDEPGLRDMLSILFRRDGYEVTTAAGVIAAREALSNATKAYGVVLADLMMPDGSGLEIVTFAKAQRTDIEVIIMTAHSTIETAIDAMKRGAYDFVTKPFATAELRVLVAKAFERRALVTENTRLKAQVARHQPKDFLGHSPAMKIIVGLVERIAVGRSTVLITGESGTGKERVARFIHDSSDRKDKPFRVVNCGAIPESLMESELFGHEKGAFTGADERAKAGLFRGGRRRHAVLLDEIGEMSPLAMQAKLLHVLAGAGRCAPMGSRPRSRRVDVARRGGDASGSVEERRPKTAEIPCRIFYYRLDLVIRIALPLAPRRVATICRRARASTSSIAAPAASTRRRRSCASIAPDALRAHRTTTTWPGNVRELENIIERAVALAMGQQIGLGDLPAEVSGAASRTTPALVDLPEEGCDLDQVVGEVERRLILQALERSGGVRTNAAKMLGLTLRILRYRMQKLKMYPEGEEEPTPSEPPPA